MVNQDQQGQSEADENDVSKALATIDQVAPKGWRLKLAKASVQLLVGTRVGAAVYAEARKNLDEIEGRSAMNKQLYATAARQILNDPDMVERAKARLVGGMINKQENLEAVISGASNRVIQPRLLTGQIMTDQDNQQVNNTEIDPADDKPLNADWATTFTEVAEGATSDELRERLSRMLLGELKSAGTFPRATIRTIAELEQSDLEGLVSVLPFTYGNLIIKDNSISKETLELLHDCGLIDYNPTLMNSMTWSASPESSGALTGREWAVIMEVSSAKSIKFNILHLTRTGKAVVSLLDKFDEKLTLKTFIEGMDTENVNRVVLGKFESLPDNQIKVEGGEVIFQKQGNYNIFSAITQPSLYQHPK